MASTFINYSTLNSVHNWEDLCIQLKNQQTCTFDNHKETRGGPILNPSFADASS